MADTRDRQTSISKLARQLLDENPLLFDTETTGLDSRAEIVEIAVISCDGTVLLDTLVRPTSPIPSGATAVHGISDADVRNARPWREVHGDMASLLAPSGRVLTSYNREYDLRLVKQSVDATRGKSAPLPIKESSVSPSCIMQLYAIWKGEWNDYHGSYRWQKLETALYDLGIRREGDAHRALSDTKGALEVLKAMASEGRYGGGVPKENQGWLSRILGR